MKKFSLFALSLVLIFVSVGAITLLSPETGISQGLPDDGSVLKRYRAEICHACHKTEKSSPGNSDAIKSHNSINTGSDKWTPLGWGIEGGKYGEFVCTTCHTTHGTSNIYLIRENITTPDGSDWATSGTPVVNIDFRRLSGSFGAEGLLGDDTDAPRDASSRVCEACHSLTNYNTFSNTEVAAHALTPNCADCHLHSAGFQPLPADVNNCITCHKRQRGSRRQIADSNGDGTGTGGDFIKKSHHIYNAFGTVNNSDCVVCHDVSQHGTGIIKLKDADTGTVYNYNPLSPVTAEAHCLSCHDSDGANGNMSPFSDSRTLGTTSSFSSSRLPSGNEPVTIGWTNPQNAYADDSIYATAAPALNSTVVSHWMGFGLNGAIPQDSIIDRVKIIAEYRVTSTTSTATLRAQANVYGTDCPTTARTNSAKPASDTVVSFDITSCRSWSRADFMDDVFKVKIGARRGDSGTAVTFYLDYVKVEVSYNRMSFRGSAAIKNNWNKTFGHKQTGLTCLGTGSPNTGCHSNGHGSDYVGLLSKNLTLPTTRESEGISYKTANEYAYELCFNCHSNYPGKRKEDILGVKAGSKYDNNHLWGSGITPPYYIPSTITRFKDRYDGSAKFYDDQDGWREPGTYYNLHFYHLQEYDYWDNRGAWKYRDNVYSLTHCLTCHNVHGSNTAQGWIYDEMQYNHYAGQENDLYGKIGLPNLNLLDVYPIGCAYNCHSTFGAKHNWFEPAGE